MAKIYAQILCDVGILSKGDVIFKTASEFVGDVIGASSTKTRDILNAARGKVLVIDEAYCLFSSKGDPFKEDVINTIVEQVQPGTDEDRAVLLLGYREEMEEMLRKSNPGLARRFPLATAFNFADYDDASLVRILIGKAKSQGLSVETSVAKRAVSALAAARAKPHFGNAGAVDSLLSQAKLQMQSRGGTGAGVLSVEDFGVDKRPGVDKQELGKVFDGLVGCQGVVRQMKDIMATIEFAVAQGDDPREKVRRRTFTDCACIDEGSSC